MALLSTTRNTTELLAAPLPVSNVHLSHVGLAVRRGQFSLLAAAPGVGKTLFATNLAIKTKVPALYFSADSDEWTVKTRACSILTGQPLTQVEKNLNTDDWWSGFYGEQLTTVDHVDWCYQSDIDPEFIVLRLQAYAELRGEYPHLMVVDNLGNTVGDGGDEYAELRSICRELQRIARSTNAHIMALHHVKGAREDGWQEITQADLLGNIAKIPELVLGLNRKDEASLSLYVAKNRGGKSGIRVPVPVDYTTATIGGYK